MRLRRHEGAGVSRRPTTDAAARSSSSLPAPTTKSDGLTKPPISPMRTAAATTIGNGTSKTKMATNELPATAAIRPFASVVRPSRTIACATIATTAAASPANAPATHPRSPCVTKSHDRPEEEEEAREHERDPGDQAAAHPVEQPTHVRRELHRLRTREQHAEAERVQEPALVDPSPALDQLLMHQRDLPGGSAEVHEAEPDPESGRLAERGGPRRRGGRRLLWRARHRDRGYARRGQRRSQRR